MHLHNDLVDLLLTLMEEGNDVMHVWGLRSVLLRRLRSRSQVDGTVTTQ